MGGMGGNLCNNRTIQECSKSKSKKKDCKPVDFVGNLRDNCRSVRTHKGRYIGARRVYKMKK